MFKEQIRAVLDGKMWMDTNPLPSDEIPAGCRTAVTKALLSVRESIKDEQGRALWEALYKLS